MKFIQDLDNDFLQDEKKLDRIIKNLEGKTPSFIKTLFNNIVAQKIIRNKDILSYEDVLIEIFEVNHSTSNPADLTVFLNENGITQERIAHLMNVSLRQVRNNLNTK